MRQLWCSHLICWSLFLKFDKHCNCKVMYCLYFIMSVISFGLTCTFPVIFIHIGRMGINVHWPVVAIPSFRLCWESFHSFQLLLVMFIVKLQSIKEFDKKSCDATCGWHGTFDQSALIDDLVSSQLNWSFFSTISIFSLWCI